MYHGPRPMVLWISINILLIIGPVFHKFHCSTARSEITIYRRIRPPGTYARKIRPLTLKCFSRKAALGGPAVCPLRGHLRLLCDKSKIARGPRSCEQVHTAAARCLRVQTPWQPGLGAAGTSARAGNDPERVARARLESRRCTVAAPSP